MPSVTVDIPDYAMEYIRHLADVRGVTTDEYIREAVARLAPEPLPPKTPEERVRELREWVATLKPSPGGATMDDSRESIY